MKKHSLYKYETGIIEDGEYKGKYDYKIHDVDCYPYQPGIIESDEWYDTEDEADEAARNHIDELENPDV